MGMTNAGEPGRGGGGARRPASIGGLRRSDPLVRRVALSWRRLMDEGEHPGGRGRGRDAATLVACSGGADSTALLLCLALATRRIAVCHVRHDMRPAPRADADRDWVRSLAGRLALPFEEEEVRTAGRAGNAEALARRGRYAALARAAARAGCRYIATAHHADDQLETMLMALLRGAGPEGLRGIAPRRRLPGGAVLIRPMLMATRREAVRACREAGIAWREDETNADLSRFRAALRARVLPLLEEMRPAGPLAAARSAMLMRDASATIDERTRAVFGESDEWERARLRAEPAIVVGAGLRHAARRLLGGGADRLSWRLVDAAVRAVRDRSTEPREFHWPGGLVLAVLASRVTIRRDQREGGG